MPITHSVVKASGDRGYAADWNADHTVTEPNTAKRTATLIIAASDSLDAARADYVCDGTADAVQLQQAHDALPAAGGRILLLEGNFYFHTALGGAYVTATKNNVTVQGQGCGTILHWDATAGTFPTAFFLNPATGFRLHDVQIVVGGAGSSWLMLANNGSHNYELRDIYGTGAIIFIETAGTCNYGRLFNLSLWNTTVNISLTAGTRCDFEKIRGTAVDIDFWSGVTKSVISNNNVHHIHLQLGADTNMVHDNITNTLINGGAGNDLQDNVTGW